MNTELNDIQQKKNRLLLIMDPYYQVDYESINYLQRKII